MRDRRWQRQRGLATRSREGDELKIGSTVFEVTAPEIVAPAAEPEAPPPPPPPPPPPAPVAEIVADSGAPGTRLALSLELAPEDGELFIAIIGTPASRREGKRIHAEVEAEIHRFEARLGPRRDDPAYSLSYANRRRTEIARAMALGPTLLVLDEPTAGMNQSETGEGLGQLLEL